MFSRSSNSNNNPYANPPPPPQYQQRPGAANPGYQPTMLRIQNAPDPSYVVSNVIAVPPTMFRDGQYVIVNDQFVFTVRYVLSTLLFTKLTAVELLIE